MELEVSSRTKQISSKNLIKFLFDLLSSTWESIFKTNRLLLISFINIFKEKKDKVQIIFQISSLKLTTRCHLSGNLLPSTLMSVSMAKSRRKAEDKNTFIKEITLENKPVSTRQACLELKRSYQPQQFLINEE